MHGKGNGNYIVGLTLSKQALSKNICMVEKATMLVAQELTVIVFSGLDYSRALSIKLPNLAFVINL